MIKIKNTSTGNCPCMMCGKSQEGMKLQPITVWWKRPGAKRGTNYPVCSSNCAELLSATFNRCEAELSLNAEYGRMVTIYNEAEDTFEKVVIHE